MAINELLLKKRYKQELSRREIHEFILGVTDGSIADYQISAMLMAIAINGMSDRETLDLTTEMTHSGQVLDLSAVQGIKIDKHSTGGVGDTTSLVLTPLVAACGLKVAKMSGRGLGFTGGTLDKLESIPGFCVGLNLDKFISNVNEYGLSIISQTAELAPADKVLYGLRDVTATANVMPLIVSSILSKKIAAGCDVVVLDVKTGSGAMMKTLPEAFELAESMVRIGNMTGRKYAALVTDMNQPLGNYIGNALEVYEAIEILSGCADGDLKTVSLNLGANILKLAGTVNTVDEGVDLLNAKIASGEGLKKLYQMIQAQNGNPEVVYNPSLLPRSNKLEAVLSPDNGYITRIDASLIGMAAKVLGAGREKKTDPIDMAAGIVLNKRLGDKVNKGDVLLTMHKGNLSDAERARAYIADAITIGDKPCKKLPLIYKLIE